jgi:hypothetical protein
MRGGHNRKLPSIAALEGNRGHKALADFEAAGVEACGAPFIAEHLPLDAQGCIEVITASMPRSVYSTLDSFLLAAFATAWAIHKTACLEIANPAFEPVTTNAQGAQVVNPWLSILDKQAALMASLGSRLGLDPVSRAALKVPGVRKRSAFEGLIGRHSARPVLPGN